MELDEIREHTLKSHLAFTKVFYEIKNGRPFITPPPIGRQSHYEIISKELEDCFYMRTRRLLINVPPGHGKSSLLVYFIAWAIAQYPDSNFLYVSYSAHLAEKHTATIKEIIEMPLYKKLYGVELRKDSQAKGNFKTTKGGTVMAFGSSGSVTGNDAGLPGLDRFSGMAVIDDAHKPDEVHSDTIRLGVIDNYSETIKMRPRSPNVPIVFLGQRTHEDDLAQFLIDGRDGYEWKKVILEGLDAAGNALAPHIMTKEQILIELDKNPYAAWAQIQQKPQPSGGGIFKPEWFPILDEEPKILETFLTIDTAESAKEWADATAFSFWGLYKIHQKGIDIEEYGLHWLNAVELRIEPKDLESEFYAFYADCMRYKVKPKCVVVEKKSTGVTLASTLKAIQGLRAIEVERTIASGCKTARYFEMQRYVASKYISLPFGAKHTPVVIEHMRKITANDSHKSDDMCFVAGTKVATLFGHRNIEDLRVGDRVITPLGIGKVIACGCTGSYPIIKRIGLIGTRGHPIYSENQFKPLDTIYDAGKISKLSFIEILRWKYKNLLCSMELNTNLWGREDITLVGSRILKKEEILKDFMLLFTNFIVGKRFRKAMLFITKTIIILIMTSLIWSVFQCSNIVMSLWSSALQKTRNQFTRLLKRQEIGQRNGIGAKREENGILKMLQSQLKRGKRSVLFVISHLFTEKLVQPLLLVAQNAIPLNTEEVLETLQPIVLFAETNSLQKKDIRNQETERHAQLNVQGMDIRKVYNLTVETYGVYYANDILVSNCDTCYDAVRLALIDKTLIAPLKVDYNELGKSIFSDAKHVDRLRKIAYTR